MSRGNIHARFADGKVIGKRDEEDLSFFDASWRHLDANRLLRSLSPQFRLEHISFGQSTRRNDVDLHGNVLGRLVGEGTLFVVSYFGRHDRSDIVIVCPSLLL